MICKKQENTNICSVCGCISLLDNEKPANSRLKSRECAGYFSSAE